MQFQTLSPSKKRLAIPDGIADLDRGLRIIRNGLRAIRDNSGKTLELRWLPETIVVPGEMLGKHVGHRVVRTFRMNGVGILQNARVSLKKLLQMAVEKTRPFEEEGEKGFRDTIILYTILQHAKSLAQGNRVVLFISNDDVFAHEDVMAIVAQHGVRMERVGSLRDAVAYVQQQAEAEERAALDERANRLRAFLLSQKNYILDYVRQARASEDFFSEATFSVPSVDEPMEIHELDLRDIERPSPILLPMDVTEGDANVSFVAVLSVDATFRRHVFSAEPRFVPLREGKIKKGTTPSPLDWKEVTERRRFDKRLEFKALLHIVEGAPETYSDLKLEGVTVAQPHYTVNVQT